MLSLIPCRERGNLIENCSKPVNIAIIIVLYRQRNENAMYGTTPLFEDNIPVCFCTTEKGTEVNVMHSAMPTLAGYRRRNCKDNWFWNTKWNRDCPNWARIEDLSRNHNAETPVPINLQSSKRFFHCLQLEINFLNRLQIGSLEIWHFVENPGNAKRKIVSHRNIHFSAGHLRQNRVHYCQSTHRHAVQHYNRALTPVCPSGKTHFLFPICQVAKNVFFKGNFNNIIRKC